MTKTKTSKSKTIKDSLTKFWGKLKFTKQDTILIKLIKIFGWLLPAGLAFYPLVIILVVSLFLAGYLIAGLGVWLAVKKIKRKGIKIAVVSALIIFGLVFGTYWTKTFSSWAAKNDKRITQVAGNLNNGNKSQSITQISAGLSQPSSTPQSTPGSVQQIADQKVPSPSPTAVPSNIQTPQPQIQTTSQSYTPATPTKTSKCQENNGLPDSACTPGAINQNVTQGNIKSTICVSGYTATIRPSSSYTTSLKIKQIQEYGYSDTSTSSYEEDHLIPLEIGGSPTDPANLWPEPYNITYGARSKDKVENYLHAQICSGAITLAEAQKEDATNWEAVYNNHYGTISGGSGSTSDDAVTSNPVVSTPAAVAKPTTTVNQSTDGPQVKKSSSGICHEKGVSQYYNQTKTFTPYNSIADCLASGGRLPK